jgi:L-ascorbate metabolism protein UlaG (beta-lactamase superfamily)
MPVNGVRVGGEPPQETPAVLTPAQAVDAAIALRAGIMVPIHYGQDSPPDYDEVDDALGISAAEAERRGVAFRHMKPGETITIED